MVTKKIVGSKSILRKVLVFLVMSVSFLSLSIQDVFAKATTDRSQLIKNVKDVGHDTYYKGDFYSDVKAYPEEMFPVVEELIGSYIAFPHMGEALLLNSVGGFFIQQINGQVVNRYITVKQGKTYYCIDIYNNSNKNPIATLTSRLSVEKKKNGYLITPNYDLKIKYKGKLYQDYEALNFLGFY
ncbi:MAG: hypothetical protein HXM14_00790 [Fusobacterium periodonticum]|nr:hypothetical protein [Fusobacterium periodonticum]